MGAVGKGVVTDGRATRSLSTTAGPGAPRERELGLVAGGRFRVDGMLGRGGMGIVYRAHHVSLDEPIALKVLSSDVSSRSDAVARFLREARACARLRSPHVVRVLDAGTLEDGAPYVAMELLEGSDLGAVLGERGSLSIPEAVGHVLAACEALREAHALGIVHRDIKPSNLFVQSSGALKVLDFGIAKVGDPLSPEGAGGVTASSAVLGSPAYMAPEQIRRSSAVDSRADIWSLGVVLFELVSGKLPFSGDTAPALLAAISADPPLGLRQVAPDAPRELERVIASCLERDPTRRPRDVDELMRKLGPLVGGERVRRPRRPVVLAAAGVTVVAASALALGAPSRDVSVLETATRPISARVSEIARPHREPLPALPERAEPAKPVEPAEPAEPAHDTRAAVLPALPRQRASLRARDSFQSTLESATAHRK